jgi:hypothetical protein
MTAATLERRAEIAKLARLLELDPGAFEYLEAVEPAEIARYREQATDLLYDADRVRLKRMADASRLLPVQVLAAIGRNALGPLLCARLTGLLDARRAIEIAEHLPSPFLAELGAEMDPRRATEVIAGMPAEQVAEVAAEMARRGEHVAMGRFVAHLSDPALAACVEVAGDADLLRVALVLDGKERLAQIAGLLSEERLAALGRAAADESLWPELLELSRHLPEDERCRLARAAFATLDDAEIAALAQTVEAEGLVDAVRPLVACLDESAGEHVAELAPQLGR